MAKIRVNQVIKSNALKSIRNTFNAIKNDKLITFYDDNSTLMKIKFEDSIVSIEKENKSIHIKMNFKYNRELEGTYEIKELNSYLNLKTVTKKLEVRKDGITIIYDLYMQNQFSDTFTYNLEWSG